MIKTLYKIFQHWSESGSVYIISDPHFGNIDMNWRIKLIDKLEGTDHSILSDEDIAIYIANYIIVEINKVCRKSDTLIVLGDIGDVDYIKQLKAGYRVLIKGNHDQGDEKYLSKYNLEDIDPKFRPGYTKKKYTTHLFDEVYSGTLTISDKIILSHEPIRGPWLNIHGHEHHTRFTEGISQENNWDADNHFGYKTIYLNVSTEVNAFRPINLKDLIDTGILKQIDSIHRITIDKATNNKLRKL